MCKFPGLTSTSQRRTTKPPPPQQGTTLKSVPGTETRLRLPDSLPHCPSRTSSPKDRKVPLTFFAERENIHCLDPPGRTPTLGQRRVQDTDWVQGSRWGRGAGTDGTPTISNSHLWRPDLPSDPESNPGSSLPLREPRRGKDE